MYGTFAVRPLSSPTDSPTSASAPSPSTAAVLGSAHVEFSKERPPTAEELAEASLIGADLAGIDFSGQDLSGRDLSRADLRGAILLGTNLEGASLAEARLEEAEFSGANLQGAILRDASARRAGFGMARLAGAVFTLAELEDASFTRAELRGADLSGVNARHARFSDADLSGATVESADLREADLSDARVHDADFRRADLRGATLRGLRGYGDANWIDVDLRDTNFSGAFLCRRFILDQNFLEEFKSQGAFAGVLFWIWHVTSDCGRSLLRWALWTMALATVFGAAYRHVDIRYANEETWLSPLYFSVVTLTTLGYGDAVPASPTAQAVAMLEVVCGYMMLGGVLSIFSNKMARRAD